ncbi:hypothetical protein K491DRAFT_716751 [Lophiostoma macrostomum CBS 122681]|uniref:Uncharacterized protein n=1 Tax=Lophiostoma macrostomum CBS 122681 TaxID=1314788 RepID=A0A6A6T5C2_9PLEO|nr:hypothetical protein K491DRAFT_716751 [Lophiostoma macrostomum CBS 122681]
MGDATSTLLPPSTGTFTPGTPSALTPNTRTEAEAALTHNTIAQTDSAAPTTPLAYGGNGSSSFPPGSDSADKLTEAQRSYRRPAGPLRTSSTNYEKARLEALGQDSVSSDVSLETRLSRTDESTTTTTTSTSGAGTGTGIASPTSATPSPFPAVLDSIDPKQGVVPLNPGIGQGQQEAVKKARGRGLSLGMLGRQQSWSEQDMKHVYSAGWMGEVKGEGVATGYESGRVE